MPYTIKTNCLALLATIALDSSENSLSKEVVIDFRSFFGYPVIKCLSSDPRGILANRRTWIIASGAWARSREIWRWRVVYKWMSWLLLESLCISLSAQKQKNGWFISSSFTMKTGNMLLARMIEDKNRIPWQNKGKMDRKAQESMGTQFQDLYIRCKSFSCLFIKSCSFVLIFLVPCYNCIGYNKL